MSHLLHHTNGYIIGSRDYGEANRLYYLLTRDHGLIMALAQSVRELRSKLRYQLRDFVRLRLTLVRGREIWRITAVESGGALDPFLPPEQALLKRLFLLLCRFVPAEEKSQELFAVIGRLDEELRSGHRPAAELYRWELLTVLSLLQILGYVPAADVPSEPAALVPAQAVAVINRAFHHSHL